MIVTTAVNLVVEDDLSEAILRRLLETTASHLVVDQCKVGGGFGYLKNRSASYNLAASHKPFILLTDLDQAECPASLIAAWLPSPRHPNFLLRVAVREVESWLLADRNGLAEYLGVSAAQIPRDSDTLDDPKRSLIACARRSRRRDVRESLVPDPKTTAIQGPDYNGCLARFVVENWNVTRAANNSPSLHRTIHRLSKFTRA